MLRWQTGLPWIPQRACTHVDDTSSSENYVRLRSTDKQVIKDVNDAKRVNVYTEIEQLVT
ncbi:hypothetical protein PsorP6_003634 [Peronosclerospora sorghi]|uniref:Uncharacterized protein n=1 Tax=Peronosclerospora sorghi TaxID=230839 RepID=A0ACC0VQS3_9STRA|nr:hypothetical protein PsorP6_003634 [Peronosclerospora sorghi]